MTCDWCGQEIAVDAEKAYGPGDKVSHRRCGKVATAHGKRVEMIMCDNCGALRPEDDVCFECGVSSRVG